MAVGSWSKGSCWPPPVEETWWYGVEDGAHYWTRRYGQYFVGGGVHLRYAQQNYECGQLGPPVKAYQWLAEFGAYGMWFLGGAVIWSFEFGSWDWRVKLGDWGQTAGRDAELSIVEPPEGAEQPPDPPEDVPAPPPPDLD